MPVPPPAFFYGASLGVTIQRYQAELLLVPMSPFEVIHERPDAIPAHRHPHLPCRMHGSDVFAQEVDTPSVLHQVAGLGGIVEGNAIFGHEDCGRTIVAMYSE